MRAAVGHENFMAEAMHKLQKQGRVQSGDGQRVAQRTQRRPMKFAAKRAGTNDENDRQNGERAGSDVHPDVAVFADAARQPPLNPLVRHADQIDDDEREPIRAAIVDAIPQRFAEQQPKNAIFEKMDFFSGVYRKNLQRLPKARVQAEPAQTGIHIRPQRLAQKKGVYRRNRAKCEQPRRLLRFHAQQENEQRHAA